MDTRRARPVDDAEDDIVPLPRERAGLPKVLVVMGLIVAMFGALALGGRQWWQRQVDPPGPPGEEVTVDIPNGARLTDLGSLLDGPRVVSNGTLFRFWIRDKDIDLQAGRYVFQRNSSFEEVEDVLREGPVEVATRSITIPEGQRIDQMIATIAEEVPRFSEEDLRAAVEDPANRSPLLPPDRELPEGVPPQEGTLFPSTYEVGPNDTPATLVRRMVELMTRTAQETGLDRGLSGDNLPPLSPYEVLIVASLIERETGNSQESAKIARVIYNRMLFGPEYGIFALGIDAVNQYEADVTGRDLDLESPSPYNSRATLALPPTPIAAPGRASIEAALNPAPNSVDGLPLLYYVLEAPGQHFFTGDNAEFQAAVARCREAGLC
ncbi:endolytic transglycosylase MltG [Iamia sp. SCSIO 61187]|uniref:endolytic transglycosylase MltG n=1 Tax=Iamia sp. SCSIO 61187 TaxID=2722752 RepID=UPI001C635FDE|nr:endolytic transglycosylase MltG [Iamia sp. SCSIO 61187]QYG93379.1 endolytic transglycosylase MltG [Iamia sp. SCSIO 61187]